MAELTIYYLIGIIVSIFHIWFYRYSKFKKSPKKSDSIAALFGMWLWPVQILLFLYQQIYKSE
jgi:O-antigen/teichoic acid export membrane protein